MNRLFLSILSATLFSEALSSCDTEGCTDPSAANFDEKADSDDGNCRYDSDPFEGKWDLTDSIETTPNVYVPEEVRLMDIRIISTDRDRLRIFWKNANGSLSDTIDATAKPNTLSIAPQEFGEGFIIQGNFIYNGLYDYIETEYRVSSDTSLVRRIGRADRRD
jgi:hypothetical protein